MPDSVSSRCAKVVLEQHEHRDGSPQFVVLSRLVSNHFKSHSGNNQTNTITIGSDKPFAYRCNGKILITTITWSIDAIKSLTKTKIIYLSGAANLSLLGDLSEKHNLYK